MHSLFASGHVLWQISVRISDIISSFFIALTLSVCQVKTQTQILISHWRRRGVCPSRHRRARTTCACVDASSDASNGLVIVNVYSQSPPTTVEKVLISLLQMPILLLIVKPNECRTLVSFLVSWCPTVSVWNCLCVRSGWQWPALLLASAGRLWGALSAEMGLRAPPRGRLQQGRS